MKNVEGESPRLLPAAPGLAENDVYDFLYVDRSRISALYAQLFPQGTLTSVKTTSQQGFTDDHNVGSDLKIIKAEVKSADSGSEGIEHVFDASWAVPLEVLKELNNRSIIRFSLKGTDRVVNMGAVVLLTGYLRMIDYATMKDLWEPALKILGGENQPGVDMVVALIKGLPHTLHAHFLTNDGYLWSSLSPDNLLVPTADIILKYGSRVISGQWNMLCVVDAYPTFAQEEVVDDWSAGDATKGILQVMEAFRMHIGRPLAWFGVTPLMIYRSVSAAADAD